MARTELRLTLLGAKQFKLLAMTKYKKSSGGTQSLKCYLAVSTYRLLGVSRVESASRPLPLGLAPAVCKTWVFGHLYVWGRLRHNDGGRSQG